MKYVDEFRDWALAQSLIEAIRRQARRPWVIMDVCGGQTHSLLRHGIESALQDRIELIHGPGCPVCVTPIEAIDFAQRLALRPKTIVASFGDMLRVPGSRDSLLAVRSQGGAIRAVASPLDALKLARQLPDHQIVFLAVGFETTAPATALAVLQTQREQIRNFSLIVAHVRVLPAMEALMLAPGNRVQGFLGAGHVCTITGLKGYPEFVERFRVPVVATGFEPVDLLHGIREVVSQLESGSPRLVNAYARSVRAEGNPSARRLIEQVYAIADTPWRGFGTVAAGGYALREEYRDWDARHRFCEAPFPEMVPEPGCLSGQVLTGRIKPIDCPEFGRTCHPDHPRGAPMVSSEGACAAYFRYQNGHQVNFMKVNEQTRAQSHQPEMR
jgi:hydrogenase expression/formation protein HypD